MRRIAFFLVCSLLVVPVVMAQRSKQPANFTNLSDPNQLTEFNNILSDFWNITNGRYTLENITTNPDGSRPGLAGDLVYATFGGGDHLCINTSLHADTTPTDWTCIDISVLDTCPGGADTQVQFNDNGNCAGDAGFVYDKNSDSVGIGSVVLPGASLEIDPVNVTNLAAEDIQFRSSSQTLTLVTGTTLANQRQNQFFAPVINGVSGGATETVTDAATVYIDGPPSGSNITLTNPYALWVNTGNVSLGRAAGTVTLRTINQTTSNADGRHIQWTTANGNNDVGYGGNFRITTGNGGSVGPSQGGDIIIDTGDGSGAGAAASGGLINITTGTGGPNGDGGDFSVALANGRGTGAGGSIDLEAGTASVGGSGGYALLEAGGLGVGADATSTAGNAIVRSAANNIDAAGDTGDVLISTGNPGSNANNGSAGDITLTIGTTLGTNKNGGNIIVTAGNTTGSGTGGSFLVDRTDVTSITAEQIPYQFRNTSIGVADGTTITDQKGLHVLAPTINGVAGGGVETITNAATLYIDAAPSGSNITFTNGPYALWVDAGTSRLDGTTSMQDSAEVTGQLVVFNSNSLGWTVQTGANTACNTTCTMACVFGQDTDTANGPIVGCADTTADRCLCAGAN